MNTYVEFLLLGLGNGGVFAALAMALVVTYRSSGVLNFATGAQALYAAYTYSLLRNGQLLIPIPGIGPTVSVGSNLGFWPALLITLAIQAVMGAVVYLLVFRPLRNHRPVAKAVASIGLMGLLTAVVTYQVGTQVVLVNPIFPQNHVSFLGVSISTDRLWLAGTIIALGIVLTVIFRFTRFGLATRASAETEVGALVSGLSPDRIALVNWIISFVVSGIAGVLIAPLVPLQPGTYTLFIVPALAAAVVGRFHSLGWAITAGLAIGALESLSVYVNGVHPDFPAGAGELIPLILVLVVLAVRGQTMPSRGTLTQVTLGRAPRPHWRIATAIVGTAIGIAAIYLFTGNDRAALYASFITGVISLSLVVVTGYTGQISLAQLTLAGVSAYILSTFATSWGIPFPIAPILSALVAAAAGVVIGIPALRVRGLMLGVVTLTFAAGVEAIWFNNNSIDGGASGTEHSHAAPVRHEPGHRVGQGLPPARLRHSVSRRAGPRRVGGELAAHQPPGHRHAGGALGRALGGGGGHQRGAGQAHRLRHRGVHRRAGWIAAGVPVGERDVPGLRCLPRPGRLLHRRGGGHHVGERRHPRRHDLFGRPPGGADLLGGRQRRRRQLVRRRRRHRRDPDRDLQPGGRRRARRICSWSSSGRRGRWPGRRARWWRATGATPSCGERVGAVGGPGLRDERTYRRCCDAVHDDDPEPQAPGRCSRCGTSPFATAASPPSTT